MATRQASTTVRLKDGNTVIDQFVFYVPNFLLVALITLLTVGGQVIRTAQVNPAESLRYE